MLDLHLLPEAGFDAVVCYGAALCYTYNRYPQALHELIRLLKPGGRLLISVDSLYGTLRLIGPFDALSFIESPDAHFDWRGILDEDRLEDQASLGIKEKTQPGVFLSKPGSPEFHQPLVFFTSRGLKQSLEQAELQVIEMASANPLVADGNQMPKVTSSPQACQALLELEVAVCNQPGLLDAGEHLIAVAAKRSKRYDGNRHRV
jgi:SAM-dependent methyltransferase